MVSMSVLTGVSAQRPPYDSTREGVFPPWHPATPSYPALFHSS